MSSASTREDERPSKSSLVETFPKSSGAFSGWDEYMTIKRTKLANQWEQHQGAFKETTPTTADNSCLIFKGITIYVNGYTKPTALELRDIIMEYGGNYEYWLSKRRVTHIVATNLTDKKIEQLSRSDKVVRPEWITESVTAGRLLPWSEYRLYSSCELIPNQQSLLGLLPVQEKPLKLNESLVHSNISNQSTTIFSDKCPQNNTSSCSTSFVLNRQSTHDSLKTDDPTFLKNYYYSSRLHHLSTWKSELKKFVSDFRLENPRTRCHPTNRVIMHVDMDCFFASVAVRDRPELNAKPIAISHSKGDLTTGSRGSSDVASCNYIARQFGVRNGMSTGQALQRCPSLVFLPYEFEKYAQVSKSIYSIFLEIADDIQVGSCDEASIDVSSRVQQHVNQFPSCGLKESIHAIAKEIRTTIQENSGCTASIGASYNQLLARLCTQRAKPNGQFALLPNEVDSFMETIKISNLPGVGHALREALAELNVETCLEAQRFSLVELQELLGSKKGSMIYYFSRGEDDRELHGSDMTRKSIGAEVNWGVRFENQEQVDKFLLNLSEEVAKRLLHANCLGGQLVLKLKRRAENAGEPSKYLGHGITENASKSVVLLTPSNDAGVIYREAFRLLSCLNCPPIDIRGLGIQMQKLSSLAKKSSTTQTLLPLKAKRTIDAHFDEQDNQENSRVNDDFCEQTDVDEYFDNSDPDEDHQLTLKLKDNIHFEKCLLPEECTREHQKRCVIQHDITVGERKSKLVPSYSAHFDELRWSQLDKDVLDALPISIQNEITEMVALKSDPPKFTKRSVSWTAKSMSPKNKKKRAQGDEKLTLTQQWKRAGSSNEETLDWSTLKELPEDIRREVLLNYAAKKSERKAEFQLNTAEKRKEFVDIKEERDAEIYGAVEGAIIKREKPNLMGCVAIDDIREIIATWMKSTKIPLQQDLYDVTAYLRSLVDDFQLDTASKALQFMIFKARQSDEWRVSTQLIAESVQKHVFEKYQAQLFI